MKNNENSNIEIYRNFINSVNEEDLDNENNILFCYNRKPNERGEEAIFCWCNLSLNDFIKMVYSAIAKNFKREQAKIFCIALLNTFYRDKEVLEKIGETLSEQEQISIVDLMLGIYKDVRGTKNEK